MSAALAQAQHPVFPGGTPRSGFPRLHTVLLSNPSAGIRERLVCLGIGTTVPTHDLLSEHLPEKAVTPPRAAHGREMHLIVAGPTPSGSDHSPTCRACIPTLACTSSSVLMYSQPPRVGSGSPVLLDALRSGEGLGTVTPGRSPCSCGAICIAE